MSPPIYPLEWCKNCNAIMNVRLQMTRDAWTCLSCGIETNGMEAHNASKHSSDS